MSPAGREYLHRSGLILASAYLGSIVGYGLSNGISAVDFSHFIPLGMIAIFGMSWMTPNANIVVTVWTLLSLVFLFVHKIPRWWSAFLLLGFTGLTYVLISMWQSG